MIISPCLIIVLINHLIHPVEIIYWLRVRIEREPVGELFDLALDAQNLANLHDSWTLYKIFSHKMSVITRITWTEFWESQLLHKR